MECLGIRFRGVCLCQECSPQELEISSVNLMEEEELERKSVASSISATSSLPDQDWLQKASEKKELFESEESEEEETEESEQSESEESEVSEESSEEDSDEESEESEEESEKDTESTETIVTQ